MWIWYKSVHCNHVLLYCFDYRYIRFPSWPGGQAEDIWVQRDSPQAPQDLPTAGVGGHSGCDPYSSDSSCSYLTRIIILSKMWVYGIKVATDLVSSDVNVHTMLHNIHVNTHRNISITVQLYLHSVPANCFEILYH